MMWKAAAAGHVADPAPISGRRLRWLPILFGGKVISEWNKEDQGQEVYAAGRQAQ